MIFCYLWNSKSILDTDAFNEIDDQYAIAYLLRNSDKLHTKAIYAAPFFNKKVSTPAEGMEKSYGEIQKLLELLEKNTPVYKVFTERKKRPSYPPHRRILPNVQIYTLPKTLSGLNPSGM